MRSGWVERSSPKRDWSVVSLDGLVRSSLTSPEQFQQHRESSGIRFLFAPGDRSGFASLARDWDASLCDSSSTSSFESPVAHANDVLQSRFRYFSNEVVAFSHEPNWHQDPFSKTEFDPILHWSRLPEATTDVKLVWELNRFSWVFPLVRAYWRTGDVAYAERFWWLFESWRAANRPNRGINWKCGQEASLRCFALMFAVHAFALETTATQLASAVEVLARSAERVESNIGYAVSQDNNHAISESVALWSIGLLYPELKSASRWKDAGRRILIDRVSKLSYADGAFSQHSFNYQRLALQLYLFAARLATQNNDGFQSELRDPIQNSAQSLYDCQDEVTGELPQFGHNDGAHLFPLTNCPYNDFRPVIQAAMCVSRSERFYNAGPWDEEAFWVYGADAIGDSANAAQERRSVATVSGYAVLRSDDGMLFSRCGKLKHRPHHCDIGNVDIWWRGTNVVIDPGTYSYHSPSPWRNGLSRSDVHNCVTVDGIEQMQTMGQFLLLPWAQGACSAIQSDAGHQRWGCEHDGYKPIGVKVRRTVWLLDRQHWIVIDAVDSSRAHTYRVQWLLADYQVEWNDGAEVRLQTPGGSFFVACHARDGASRYSLLRADAGSTRGWRSRWCHDREPALSFECETDSGATSWDRAVFVTTFSSSRCEGQIDDKEISIASSNTHYRIDLADGLVTSRVGSSWFRDHDEEATI